MSVHMDLQGLGVIVLHGPFWRGVTGQPRFSKTLILTLFKVLGMPRIIECSVCGVPIVIKGKYSNAQTATCSKCSDKGQRKVPPNP